MPSSHSVQVTCVICVVVRNEVCRGVCRVVLVLSVVLLRHSWNTNNHKVTMKRQVTNTLELCQTLNNKEQPLQTTGTVNT
jgi:hypothetical protein